MAYNDDDNQVIQSASPPAVSPVSQAADDYYTDQSGARVANQPSRPSLPPSNAAFAANYGPDVLGGNPVGTEYSGTPIQIHDSATVPRPPTDQPSAKESPGLDPNTTYSQTAPGPVTAAARTLDAEQPQSISGVKPDYNAQIQLANAQDKQFLADRSTDAARVAAAPSSRDIERMQSELRVSKFRSQNLATDFAGGIGKRSKYAAKLAGDAVQGDTAMVQQAQAQNAAAAVPTQRNYVQDAVAQQEALAKGQLAQGALAQGQVATQEGQLKVQQQQQINKIGALLAAAKTPEEQAQHSRTLAALMGKERPAEWQALHAGGAQSIDAATGMVTKGPDNVVMVNTRTGQREVVPLGQDKPAAQYEKGKVYKDAKGNKAVWDGTRFVPQ